MHLINIKIKNNDNKFNVNLFLKSKKYLEIITKNVYKESTTNKLHFSRI